MSKLSMLLLATGLLVACDQENPTPFQSPRSMKHDKSPHRLSRDGYTILLVTRNTCGDRVPGVPIEVLLPGTHQTIVVRTNEEGEYRLQCDREGDLVAIADNYWDRCDRHFYFDNAGDMEVEFLMEC